MTLHATKPSRKLKTKKYTKHNQMCGSNSPTLPPNENLVIIVELGHIEHVGWFSHASGWWFVLSTERENGDQMPHGEYCSLSIGNITSWRAL